MTQSTNKPWIQDKNPFIPQKANAEWCFSTLEGSLEALELTRELPLGSTKKQQFKHYNLYNFWSRSQGLWFSKLVKVSVKLLSEQELSAISQIHFLDEPEFGVRMSWEYNTKEESGHMTWCVDANQPGLVFTDKTMLSTSQPQILDYQMFATSKLIITSGKYEETFVLDGDSRRLRELRYEGKLVRRLWENKFGA